MTRRLAGLAQLGALALLYWVTVPRTPQEGDTTELVLAGLRLSLAHPPGYPLQVLWNKFVISVFPVAPYFAAGLGAAALGLALFALLRRFEEYEHGTGLAAGVFATSFLVWRWSLLPDVFVGLMCFGALFLLVFQKQERYQNRLLLLLLALSVAHHHSIVFLLPLLLAPMWQHRRRWRQHAFALTALVLSLASYLLLLIFNDEVLGSWGKVDTLSDVLNFFLRKDFGTGQLSASGRATDLAWVFGNFFTSWVTGFWSLGLLACVTLWHWAKRPNLSFLKTNAALLISLGAYLVVFFPRANLSTDVLGEATLARFYLLPLLLLWALHLRAGVLRQGILAALLLTANLATNLAANFARNDFSDDTTVVDWMRNAFDELPPNATAFFSGDTEWSLAIYLQEVEGLRRDVAILGPLAANPRDFAKTAKLFPERFLREGTFRQRISPALAKFYANQYALAFLPGSKRQATGVLVRYFAEPGDLAFTCRSDFQRQRIPQLSDYREREARLALELSYGLCPFLQGLGELAAQNFPAAEKSFAMAQGLAPGLVQALERRCYARRAAGLDDSACQRELDLALESYDSLYLPQ